MIYFETKKSYISVLMKRFLKSVGHALNGWRLFFTKEKNGQIQTTVAILVLITAFALKLNLYEWIMILVCMALVLALEMVNSVIEKLVDHLHPGKHDNIKWVKDVAAGAVLWAAVISAVIGGIIFVPKLLALL